MKVLTVLGFDDEELAFEAPVPAAALAAAYWVAGTDGDSLRGAGGRSRRRTRRRCWARRPPG